MIDCQIVQPAMSEYMNTLVSPFAITSLMILVCSQSQLTV